MRPTFWCWRFCFSDKYPYWYSNVDNAPAKNVSLSLCKADCDLKYMYRSHMLISQSHVCQSIMSTEITFRSIMLPVVSLLVNSHWRFAPLRHDKTLLTNLALYIKSFVYSHMVYLGKTHFRKKTKIWHLSIARYQHHVFCAKRSICFEIAFETPNRCFVGKAAFRWHIDYVFTVLDTQKQMNGASGEDMITKFAASAKWIQHVHMPHDYAHRLLF